MSTLIFKFSSWDVLWSIPWWQSIPKDFTLFKKSLLIDGHCKAFLFCATFSLNSLLIKIVQNRSHVGYLHVCKCISGLCCSDTCLSDRKGASTILLAFGCKRLNPLNLLVVKRYSSTGTRKCVFLCNSIYRHINEPKCRGLYTKKCVEIKGTIWIHGVRDFRGADCPQLQVKRMGIDVSGIIVASSNCEFGLKVI